MVDTNADVSPCLPDFVDNPGEGTHGQRFVRLVVEERHATALVVIADQTNERCDGPVPGA
jgi:hypothetical protein